MSNIFYVISPMENSYSIITIDTYNPINEIGEKVKTPE